MSEVMVFPHTNGKRTRPHDYRHATCGRLLFRAVLPPGSEIEIRCPKCGRMVIINTDDETQDGLRQDQLGQGAAQSESVGRPDTRAG